MKKMLFGHVRNVKWMWLHPFKYLNWFDSPENWFLDYFSDLNFLSIRICGFELYWHKNNRKNDNH